MGKKKDTLVSAMEISLDPGRFISYGEVGGFINDLEDIKHQIDDLVKQGNAERAVGIYELFIAGCYEKIEEVDDSSGSMGMFFEELSCSWISARQKARLNPKETVNQMVKLIDNDDYGLCFGIEKEVVKVLHRKELSLFEKLIHSRFEDALSSGKSKSQQAVDNFSYDIRHNADILKVIYSAKKDIDSYFALCDKVGMTPQDCEVIAKIYTSSKQWKEALSFVNKGLSLEKEGSRPNQSSYELSGMKRELLSKLGHKDEALMTAWTDFKEAPSEYSYKELMKYTPKKEVKEWHNKAIMEAKKRSLPAFIKICTITKEWDILAEHILQVKHHELESIGHYTTGETAKKLSKNYPMAAAKLFRAMGIRILNSKKSKYYHHAIDHFQEAKDLYRKSQLEEEWISVVEGVRKDHYRKYSFIGDFEKIVKGHISKPPSFLKKSKEQWRKRIS